MTTGAVLAASGTTSTGASKEQLRRSIGERKKEVKQWYLVVEENQAYARHQMCVQMKALADVHGIELMKEPAKVAS